MEPDERAYLVNLCRILEVDVSSTDPNPVLALNILARMYLVPTIESHADRNTTLNEIRANLRGEFSTWSPFVTKTAQIAVLMQELPHWFNHLNEDTDVLVEQYKSIETAVFYLKLMGMGASAGAAVSAGTEWSKTGSLRDGVTKGGQRLIGQGPVVQEIQRRVGTRISPRVGGVIGAVLIVGGTLAYYNGLERMEEIKAVLMHRFQNGEMSDEQFRDVFGNEIDPSLVKKYWDL